MAQHYEYIYLICFLFEEPSIDWFCSFPLIIHRFFFFADY